MPALISWVQFASAATKQALNEHEPRNSVAKFHLGNGARLHRINRLGGLSSTGLSQGTGLMVNYLYVLDEIESNYERYTANGTVTASGEVRKLARQAHKQMKAGETP